VNVLSEFQEGAGIALDAIRAHKLRSVLTTLGIVIGVLTVTLMGTAIEGLNRAFRESVSVLGPDVLHVDRFSWFSGNRNSWMKEQNRPLITYAQIRDLQEQLTLARAVAPYTDFRAPISYQNRNSSQVFVVGTTEQFILTGGFTLATGRFLLADESAGGRPVCVLGSRVATNLFGIESPLGKAVRLGPAKFEVVGVFAPQGNFMGQFSLDNQVFIPVRQFIGTFWNNPSFLIQVKASSPEVLEETREELRGVLRKIRRLAPTDEDDFSINQQQTLIATFNRVAGTIAAVGLFITGLSLFVGAVGIMNVMFVSVAERTREIGVRKAVGARRRTILIQFLIEAVGICVLGGMIAVALAWPIIIGMRQFLPATLSITGVTLALGVSVVTGVLAGLLPAWRASRLDPVDALRSE
jgi:putative ABC transport system permease protein